LLTIYILKKTLRNHARTKLNAISKQTKKVMVDSYPGCNGRKRNGRRAMDR
jgi:hypothetical protein